MAQEDKARTMRKVFQAKIAHLPYAEQRKLTEMLREMSNERNSKLAQEGKRARPIQTNAMSNAVDMRGQEPPESPRIRQLKDVRRQPLLLPAAEQTVAREAEPVAERMAGKATELGEEVGGKLIGRTLGKALPILGDLVFPYGSISGGEMYSQQGSPSYFTNMSGDSFLPPHLEAQNRQWRQQDQMLNARQTAPSYHVDPNYHKTFAPVQLLQQQQYAEPQSIARTLATQEPNFEPASIAHQLSTEPVQSQYTNAPQVSIAREIPEPGNAPASLMEHYIKIYGSPERAREAMLNTEAYKQSQIQ